MGLTRRACLVLTLSVVLSLAVAMPPSVLHAKDGGGDSGGEGSGGGSSNSGRGGGDDGGGDDHGGHGKDDGGGATGTGSGSSDYDRARDAVRSGQIMPLKSMLKKVDADRYGRVIDIRPIRSNFRDIYLLKLRDNKGVIRTLRVDARSGVVLGSD